MNAKTITARVLLMALFLGITPVVFSAEKALVFILSGQSNMKGNGAVSELSSSQMQPIEDCYIWHKSSTEFEIVTPGVTLLNTANTTNFGPELSFVRELKAAYPDRDIYIIKYAEGGKGLDHGWSGGNWAGDNLAPNRFNFYPGVSDTDPNTGKNYINFVDTVTRGLTELQSEGVDYEIMGFLWMQGEQDARNEFAANRYASNLVQLKGRVWEDAGLVAGAPFVFGQVLPSELTTSFPYREDVRSQQLFSDHNSGTADAIANAWVVFTDSFTLGGDNVHYDTSGQLGLGKAFAATMLSALEQTVPVGRTITLRNVQTQKYMSVNSVDSLVYNDEVTAGAWEEFLVVDAGNGFVRLIGENGKSVRNFPADSARQLDANGGGGSWAVWKWVAFDHDTVLFESVVNPGKFLRKDGTTCDGAGGTGTWARWDWE